MQGDFGISSRGCSIFWVCVCGGVFVDVFLFLGICRVRGRRRKGWGVGSDQRERGLGLGKIWNWVKGKNGVDWIRKTLERNGMVR